MSDHEREIAEELNQEVDGQVKLAKNMRGYEEDERSGNSSDKEMASELGDKPEIPSKDAAKGSHKEITGRFKQYIKSIKFDKDQNMATA